MLNIEERFSCLVGESEPLDSSYLGESQASRKRLITILMFVIFLY